MSKNGAISCATCHQPELSFTDGKKVAVGLDITDRNTPTIINSFAGEWFFWDGRAHSLEHQALQPIENPKEHGFTREKVYDLLVKNYAEEYEALFGKLPLSSMPFEAKHPFDTPPQPLSLELGAYGIATLNDGEKQKEFIHQAARLKESPQELFRWQSLGLDLGQEEPALYSDEPINQVFRNVAKAIAAFERTVVANQSPFDRFLVNLNNGNDPSGAFVDGFGKQQWQGFGVFVGAGCANCHHGPTLSDQQFHNIGLEFQGLSIGRAKGIRQVQASTTFSCQAFDFSNEACDELNYLRNEAIETVGAFKTPTLRNLLKTAPYMHDGRFESLEEVLEHYQNIVEKEPGIGHTSESLLNFELTESQEQDLILFCRVWSLRFES